MIPPQELRNKYFTRSGKGYDIAEVDEYLDFIIEKYSEIFAQCDKYDKKLRIVSSRISEIQQEEEVIRRLSISTQKNCDRLAAEAEAEAKNIILKARETAEHILGEAREKAQTALALIEQKATMQIESTQKKSDALLLSARARCTKLLGDFKKEIALQRENILNIKNISEEFNSKLLSMYKNHLNLLSENTYTPNIDLEKFTESKLFDSVMQEIKNDAVEIAKKNTGVEYDFEKELQTLNESKESIYNLKTEFDETEETDGQEESNNNLGNIETESEYEETAYDNDDEDIRVFSRTGASGSDFNSDSGNQSRDAYSSGNYVENDDTEEEPLATYDSDDYGYDDEDENADDENIDENNQNYSDDNYNNAGPFDESDESDESEEPYESDDTDEAVYDGDDEYDDINEDADDEVQSKGFFGLFNKKKKKKRSARKYDSDDNDDSDDDAMDIFEDLDDE
ncbi:MAG: DivIVA domain-containing protein [Oscillospiraceae bacterium]|nr:DivIVA domain-containing protein [Oscillospiraceae bacterium]